MWLYIALILVMCLFDLIDPKLHSFHTIVHLYFLCIWRTVNIKKIRQITFKRDTVVTILLKQPNGVKFSFSHCSLHIFYLLTIREISYNTVIYKCMQFEWMPVTPCSRLEVWVRPVNAVEFSQLHPNSSWPIGFWSALSTMSVCFFKRGWTYFGALQTHWLPLFACKGSCPVIAYLCFSVTRRHKVQLMFSVSFFLPFLSLPSSLCPSLSSVIILSI